MVRFKSRYVVGNFSSAQTSADVFTKQSVLRAIQIQTEFLFGASGLADFQRTYLKYIDAVSKIVVFRLPRNFCNKFLQCLFLVTKIKNVEVRWETCNISGTLRVCKAEALKLNKSEYDVLLRNSLNKRIIHCQNSRKESISRLTEMKA